ncbi:MAG TPA: beta-ketoacyl-ACP synthase III [Actinomycetaceae bacterium]|nr:beta-ketoacyl-ACP synthase III [Actinomycetaceae bacterium]
MTELKIADTVRYSRILGVGGVRGDLVVTNDDLAGPIDSSDEWIRQRTGIVTRRRATEEQTLLAMCLEASQKALAQAGLGPTAIDTVIVASVTHLQLTPSLAAILADRLGTSGAAAWDISAACAGYPYGIGQADALIRAGTSHHVLVVGAERMSDIVDPTDRSISFLLGDGAGAAVLGPSETPGVGPTVWGSDGSRDDAIRQTHSFDDFRTGTNLSWPTLRQEGPAVFKWASFEMAKVAAKAIEAAGLKPEDIDVFVPHQANMRIIDQFMKSLSLREDVIVGRDIADTGNTSAASIPLATERLLREGQAHGGQIALQIGFGAGLAFAAQVVTLPDHHNNA